MEEILKENAVKEEAEKYLKIGADKRERKKDTEELERRIVGLEEKLSILESIEGVVEFLDNILLKDTKEDLCCNGIYAFDLREQAEKLYKEFGIMWGLRDGRM